MTITPEAIREAIKDGYEVSVIINGERYELAEVTQGKKEEAKKSLLQTVEWMLEKPTDTAQALYFMACGGIDVYNIVTGEQLTINELVKEVKTNAWNFGK